MPNLYLQSALNHRLEDAQAACAIDDRLRVLWSGHANYHLIDCYETFDERMTMIIQLLASCGLDMGSSR